MQLTAQLCLTPCWTPLSLIRPMSAPTWAIWTRSQTKRLPTRPTGLPQCPRAPHKAHVSPLLDLHEPTVRPYDTLQGPQDPPTRPTVTPHKAHSTPHEADKTTDKAHGIPQKGPCDPRRAFAWQSFAYDSWAPLILLTLMITAIRIIILTALIDIEKESSLDSKCHSQDSI